MSALNIVIIVLLILVIIGLPPLGLHSFGYLPSGGLGLLLVILLIVLLLR